MRPLTRSPRSTPTSIARSRPCDARAPPRGSAGRATPRTGRRMSTASTAVESRCWSKTWPGWSPGRTRVGAGVTPSSTTCATRTCSFTSSTRREGRTGRASTRGLAIRGRLANPTRGTSPGTCSGCARSCTDGSSATSGASGGPCVANPSGSRTCSWGTTASGPRWTRRSIGCQTSRTREGGSPASERWPGRSASSTSSSRTSSACDSPSSSR